MAGHISPVSVIIRTREAYCKKNISLKPCKSLDTHHCAPPEWIIMMENIPEWKNALLLTTLKDQSLRILRLDEKKRRGRGGTDPFLKEIRPLAGCLRIPVGRYLHIHK